MVPEINFKSIISTPTGEGATEGRNMQKAFNENFTLTANLLKALYSIVSVQVSSENVTQIKIDTNTTPYSLYYSLDPVGTEEITWHLLSTSFSSLLGQPTDNIALKSLLDAKASQSEVTSISNTVKGHTTELSGLTSDVSSLKTDVGANTKSIEDIRGDLLETVKTEEGSTLYIRYNSLTNSVEYSIDANQWTSIIATNINFADINGLPSENENLVQYVSNQITEAVAGFISNAMLVEHTSNYDNPHQVTAEQLGLGNVLDEIAELKGAANLARNRTLTEFLSSSPADDEVTYISSHYVKPESIGTFSEVARLTGDETFETVDGETITVDTVPGSTPKWYSLVYGEGETEELIVYYNEELRKYMKGGEV